MPCPIRDEEISTAQGTRGTASPGWTSGPANGCPSCRSWPHRRRAPHASRRDSCRPPARPRPGELFTAAGQTLRRPVAHARHRRKVWAEDPATGNRRDLTCEEDHAFWAWATVEVLRATGIRIEELPELSHHSLVQYRLPSTGELVPLLQIAPSKTDTERLLPID